MTSTFSVRGVFDVALVLLVIVTAWRVLPRLDLGLRERSDSIAAVPPTIKRGDALQFPGVRWVKPRNLVLVISTTCPACNANAPFYRGLVRDAAAFPDVQTLVIAAGEAVTLVSEWLRKNGIPAVTIHSLNNLASYGVIYTPTLLIVDQSGRVTDIMTRKLSEQHQGKLLARLRHPDAEPLDNSQQVRELSVDDPLLVPSSRAHVIDIRSREQYARGHRSNAQNLPSGELEARAEIELDREAPVVIDCLQPGSSGCRGAAWRLVDRGFTDVSILMRRR